ncbi:MAG TPA: TIGR04255 family protein [Pseudomonadota bacterium]|jgi:uncharacterized protein (TIGR04255 family)|nr:TIGR04255 family protein [Pseudomonadota bacterium]
MSWKITPIKHETFDRNPLIAVIGQVRFHPIVLIKQGQGVGDFQNKIRGKFPAFSEVDINSITIAQQHGPTDVMLDSQKEKQFVFATENGSTRITLGASSLTIENRAHEERQQLVEDLDATIRALEGVYGALNPTRIGLRYINAISKETLRRDLSRNRLNWSEIISDQFMYLPNLVDLEETLFYKEITSKMPMEGFLTLRYGMIKELDGEIRFRIDSDRFITQSYDVSRTQQTLISFSDDLFALYMSATGPALREWMSVSNKQKG